MLMSLSRREIPREWAIGFNGGQEGRTDTAPLSSGMDVEHVEMAVRQVAGESRQLSVVLADEHRLVGKTASATLRGR